MRVVREYFLAIIVSCEFAVIVLGALLLVVRSDLVLPVSGKLQDNQEVIKHLALLPSMLLVWVGSESKKLLFPSEDKDLVLNEWPDYWRLKIHFKATLGYAILFAGVGVVTWLLGLKVVEPRGFILLLSSVLGSGIVAVTVYFARITQKEILVGRRKGF